MNRIKILQKQAYENGIDISYDCVRERLKLNWSEHDIVNTKKNYKPVRSGSLRQKALRLLAKAEANGNKLTYQTVYSRLRCGHNEEYIINTPYGHNKNKQKPNDLFSDTQLQTMKDNNISYVLASRRVRKYGWDKEKAIVTPARSKARSHETKKEKQKKQIDTYLRDKAKEMGIERVAKLTHEHTHVIQYCIENLNSEDAALITDILKDALGEYHG